MKRRRKYLQSGARLFRKSMLIGLHRNSDLLQVPFLLPHRAKQLNYFFSINFCHRTNRIKWFCILICRTLTSHPIAVTTKFIWILLIWLKQDSTTRRISCLLLTFSNFFLLRFYFMGFLYSVTGFLLPTIFKLTQYLLWQKFGATSSPESSQ